MPFCATSRDWAGGPAVGKTVLVACTFPGGLTAAAADQKTGGDAVLRPWLMLRIDSQSVQKAAGKGTLILSDNDPYIPFTEARASFAGWPTSLSCRTRSRALQRRRQADGIARALAQSSPSRTRR